jgi:hypothetical protein
VSFLIILSWSHSDSCLITSKKFYNIGHKCQSYKELLMLRQNKLECSSLAIYLRLKKICELGHKHWLVLQIWLHLVRLINIRLTWKNARDKYSSLFSLNISNKGFYDIVQVNNIMIFSSSLFLCTMAKDQV